MKPSRRELLLLGLILALTLALRAATLFAVYGSNPDAILNPDSLTYEGPARALLATGRFDVDPRIPRPEVMRTPGYPLFLAAVYGVFGESRRAAILVQIFISVGVMAGAWWLGRRIWDGRVALLAVALLALDPVSFLYSQLMLTETLYSAALLLCVAAGLKLIASSRHELAWALALGLTLALGTHIRPVHYYLIAPVLLIVLVVKRREGRPWKSVGVVLVATALPFMLLVGGWQLRNLEATGRSEFSFIKNYNLLFYRGAGILALRDHVPFEEAQHRLERAWPNLSALSVAQRSDLEGREALALLRRYPLLAAKMQVLGVARLLFGPGGAGLRRYLGLQDQSGPAGDLLTKPLREYLRIWVLGRPGQFALFLLECALMALLYVGLLAALWRVLTADRARLAIHVLLWGIMVYLVAISAGPEAYSRFRVPLMPLFALYAAWGWLELPRGTRARKANATPPAQA